MMYNVVATRNSQIRHLIKNVNYKIPFRQDFIILRLSSDDRSLKGFVSITIFFCTDINKGQVIGPILLRHATNSYRIYQ